jgi:hypothetical protein
VSSLALDTASQPKGCVNATVNSQLLPLRKNSQSASLSFSQKFPKEFHERNFIAKSLFGKGLRKMLRKQLAMLF